MGDHEFVTDAEIAKMIQLSLDHPATEHTPPVVGAGIAVAATIFFSTRTCVAANSSSRNREGKL